MKRQASIQLIRQLIRRIEKDLDELESDRDPVQSRLFGFPSWENVKYNAREIYNTAASAE
jgi:tetrahydromethanopterin S-methyltransferase subunit B